MSKGKMTAASILDLCTSGGVLVRVDGEHLDVEDLSTDRSPDAWEQIVALLTDSKSEIIEELRRRRKPPA